MGDKSSAKRKDSKRVVAPFSVGHGITAENSRWTFGGSVPDNFADHVRRSVPLYDEGHDLICRISDYFVQQDSVVYELGVSTGKLLERLALRHEAKPRVKLIGIDVEEDMAAKARNNLSADNRVQIDVGDIVAYDYESTDLVVSYYTMQFVLPRVRQIAVDRIYQALNWGGAFLLFEKTRAPDARFQDISSGIYIDFKLERGFEPEEIVNKSRSLKGVLEPFSVQGNLDLLRRAGFVDIMPVMTYVPFTGFLAIK